MTGHETDTRLDRNHSSLARPVLLPAEPTGEAGSPFHAGEQKIQQRLGVRDSIEPWARKVVRPWLPDQHRAFYAELPFLVAAARDAAGRPWATLLTGAPGFIHSPDPRTLRVAALPSAGDALFGSLREAADVGFLGIELDSRRRNRVNGRVGSRDEEGFAFAVGQAFGNCPQYITERVWRIEEHLAPPSSRIQHELSAPLQRWIRSADTFFIATGHRGAGESETFGMDASHRGGEPGFVSVESSTSLVFPDYAGNNHYNTLGNLEVDSRAGLLFVDFDRGQLLQLTGRAVVDWSPEAAAGFSGAERVVRFELEEAIVLTNAHPLRWVRPEPARPLRVVARTQESADVTSFEFEALDAEPLAPFRAGQYLPLELDLPDHTAPLTRTYSLSGAPDADRYRISVKRESLGRGSRHLHDRVEVGDIVHTHRPRGEFVLRDDTERPIVLLSAGVGLTPTIAMLHELDASDDPRPVFFLHGARDAAHRPLAAEIERLAKREGVAAHVALSQPRSGDLASESVHAGRLDAGAIASALPEPGTGFDADYYLCGPSGWMANVQTALEARGVSNERIHFESF